ncbi:UDP-N-acetylmuramate--L-alanine ligase [Candidatus Shapirobacteria bacterium CG10_big_fil_rev_8_21_14_0_10_38_14]|uniref:UDP-N-acetylmuramate--L-alanine ligase n=1 Tax=Candidatus Shapirobacteria bacterium CG10_big_fil_rev_8_21_14_0_10_38_14 TaxID=1974483 RepID=A0A2M8L5R0_9BACT|nr:MAG: UDP-N-acetylmuramate--L-alanine ligase [Candidatus Shapirobacteria bacterium CG10_big_fil_rev_8_21_14_0_10_38_14]
MKKPDFLKKAKHIHFVGIKGVGMTALALCAQDLGIKVGGCDIGEVFVTDRILKERKIKWNVGFDPVHLQPKPDLVITTGAHGGLKNPEVLVAKKMSIPILTQAQAFGKFMSEKDGISVCGVGGKSTTASMIATVFSHAQRKPSYAIGVAEIKPLGVAGKYTSGKEFIAEADEYVNSLGVDNRVKFFFQHPKVIVVTNIEHDHPDVYPSIKETKKTFKKFFETIPSGGLLVACVDNSNVEDVVQKFPRPLQTYGCSSQANWQVKKIDSAPGQFSFKLLYRGEIFDQIEIKVPGKFNVLNATATFIVARFFGISPKLIKEGLAKFGGTKRRFEFIGETGKVKLYDDYAHHPKEIKATLEAAKTWFPQNRIAVIFQPHTYSRTKALFNEFARTFSLADLVIITDIYASAREKDDLGINSQVLVKEASKYHPQVIYKRGKKEVIEFLKKKIKFGDIIFTMGAGDIFLWHQNILKSLKN